jgi:hypothetical protein
MTSDYKQQIHERIKEPVNEHVENLKTKHPELLLTKQWNIQFPKGFVSGQNILPVITSSKKGKYLVGEVQFLLPDSLELDFDSIELLLKDEPYQKVKEAKQTPPPIDEPLETLNDIILNVNQFLQSLNLQGLQTTPQPNIPFMQHSASKVIPVQEQNAVLPTGTIEEIKTNMLRSDYLPEWFKTIESKDVKSELLNKLSEGYFHYNRQNNGNISLNDYFNTYTKYLKENNKLQYYCKYKGKSVKLDDNDYCTETYCSKKPYREVCNQATLKFGSST